MLSLALPFMPPSVSAESGPVSTEGEKNGPLGRGAPIGEVGIAATFGAMRFGDRVAHPVGSELLLATGYLDDHRRILKPSDGRTYERACEAFAHRDWWTDDEHRRWWASRLHLWPAQKAKGGNREALAFSIVEFGLDTVLATGWTRDDLRRRNILDLAEAMKHELANPVGLRLPRVMLQDEFDRRPLLTGDIVLAHDEGALGTRQPDASLAAIAAVTRKATA
jgi:hypothetical protein